MACEAAAGTGHVRHAHNLDHAATELLTGYYDYVVVGGDHGEAEDRDAIALESFAGNRPVIRVSTSAGHQSAWVHSGLPRNGAEPFAASLDAIIRNGAARQKAIASAVSLKQLIETQIQ